LGPTVVPPGATPGGAPRPAGAAAFPRGGAVVVVVDDAAGVPGTGAWGLVAGGEAGRGPVVVLVSPPRRYLPSSVPPQAGATSSTALTRAVAGITVRSANPRSPRARPVRKRSSLSACFRSFALG